MNSPVIHSDSPATRTGLVSSAWKLAFLLLAGVVCLVVFWPKPVPEAPPEVLASELARREGRLYHGNQKHPFSGVMLERYAGGGLKSRSVVHNGVLDGLSEGWHTNGQFQVREFFKQGVAHGRREKWHENGSKMSAGEIVEGKHEGVFRRWHENGTLAEELTLRRGEPDGLARTFYPSGFLQAQVTLKNGAVLEKKSWADGELKGGLAVAGPP
jgi:antitoxin component YwqK of YwqJK toxin-antitoxin module